MTILIDGQWLSTHGQPDGPWFMDQPGEYVLAQDMASHWGFVAASPGITLDLAGRTVRYNFFGAIAEDSAWELGQRGISVPAAIAPKIPSVKDFRIKNGSIEQAGEYLRKSHAILAKCVGVTVDGVNVLVQAPESAAVEGSTCNGLTVTGCVLTSECRDVPDRHNATALVHLNQPKGAVVLTGNGIYGAPAASILCYGRDETNRPSSVLIDRNTILPNGIVVNPYGIQLGNLSGVTVARNLIKGWGRGIALDSSVGIPFPSMERVLIQDNVVDVWELKHEYDVTIAFRMRTFDAGRFKDILVERNCFTARTVPGGNAGAIGARISLANLNGRNNDAGVRLRGNRFAAIRQQGGYAYGLAFSTVAPGVRPTSEEDRIESNDVCLVLGDKDGWQRPCADVTVTDPELILTDPYGEFEARSLGENPVTNCQVVGGRQSRPN